MDNSHVFRYNCFIFDGAIIFLKFLTQVIGRAVSGGAEDKAILYQFVSGDVYL